MHFDVQTYIESRLERAKPSAGDEWTALCPECRRWSKFYVNIISGHFICFSCEFRGKSVIGLVANLEGLSHSDARAYVFRNSVELRRKADLFTLSDRVRAIRPHAIVETADETEPVAVELPKVFKAVYDSGKWRLPPYLKKRRIKSATARAWGLGFCRVGHYAGRLIIPIVCPQGYSFTARDMTDEQEPKYLNPPDADHRRLLIGWNLARLTGDFAIVEGPLDALKLYQYDVSALALGGKTVHDEQLSMLLDLPSESAITVMLDGEEKTAPYEVAGKLSAHFTNIYIARLPGKIDPGKATRSQAHEAQNIDWFLDA